MKFVLRSVVVLLLIGCNNSNNATDSTPRTTESAPDSLMHDILKQHDVGMAKMNKISAARARIQQALDSMVKLPTELQKKSVQYRMELDSVFNRLTFADRGMETWMNEFNMDSLKDNKEGQVKYFESEKVKISNVTEEMTISLQKADSVLRKNN